MKKWYENPIVCFVGGICFYIAAPLLETVSAFGQSAMNKIINKWALASELDKAEAQAAAETISPTGNMTQAIGFSIDSGCDCDEYEEE